MSTCKKIKFLINPISGSHPKPEIIISKIGDYLSTKGIVFNYAVSQAPGHMKTLAQEALAEEFNIIVAVGGDGTVNEIASTLVGSDAILGIIPKGSGDGLARHLHIPTELNKALDVILEGKVIRMDHGSVNGNPFFCTMGVGYDAKVSMEYAKSGHRGLITYAEKAVEGWLSYVPLKYILKIDNQEIETKATLITVANANQWGDGFHIAPHASVTDGLFDVTVIKSLKSIHSLSMPRQVLSYSIDKNSEVETYRGKRIEIITFEPNYYHMDGEPFEFHQNSLNVEIHPHNINILIPNE